MLRQLVGSLIVLMSLLATACTSGSDSTSTVSPITASESETTTTIAEVTGTTLAAELAIEIVAPLPLSVHFASIELDSGDLAAPVRLEAQAEAPAGETVTISWTSDIDGPLGTGSELDAELSNAGGDVVSHQITATASSSGGGLGSATIELIVQILSN